MRKILYILLLLPVIGNAQIKLFGNAVENYTGAYQKMMVNSNGDSTIMLNPGDANIILKNFNGSAAGASVGSTTRLAMFSNSAFNGIMMGSFGSSPANGFSFYAWGGNNVTRTATPASAQFLVMGFNGYDGSSSASGGLLQWIAPIGWTNTTGGHLMNFEFRATSYLDNTARPRIFYNSTTEGLALQSRGTGRGSIGLFEITTPYAKWHVEAGPNDTAEYTRVPSGYTKPIKVYVLGTSEVARIDSAGNHRVPKLYVTNPTTATDVDSIVVKQNGEYVPALASTVLGGKVDSITKSNDTFYYWKLGVKYFAGLDATAGGGGGSGTVTSVSMTTPTWLTVSGSPVTTSGTLAVTAATGQTANRFLATPDGSTGAVSLRAIATGDLPTGINAANLADGSVSNTEFQYIGGLTSDAQTQLDSKAASSHTHAQSDITNLTTDLAGKQASDADLTAIAVLTPTNDDIIQRKAGAWTNRTMAQLKTDLALVKGDVGLGNVENTALSTWAGSVNITTVGTISSGTWNGGVIPGQYGGTGVANTGKTITVSGNTTIGSSTNTVTLTTTGNTNVTLPTSGTLATLAGSETLTNKSITPRVLTITSSATPTINTDNYDAVEITALATAITSMTTNLSGTPTNFQKLITRIKDTGSAQGITWGASFASGIATLPTTTVAGKTLTAGFIYNTTSSKWECVAAGSEP